MVFQDQLLTFSGQTAGYKLPTIYFIDPVLLHRSDGSTNRIELNFFFFAPNQFARCLTRAGVCRSIPQLPRASRRRCPDLLGKHRAGYRVQIQHGNRKINTLSARVCACVCVWESIRRHRILFLSLFLQRPNSACNSASAFTQADT